MNHKALILALTCFTVAASAADKTPSMEEMWSIIQQQQKTIESLQSQLNQQNQTVQQEVQQVEAQVEARLDNQEQAIAIVADAIEDQSEPTNRVKIGGYG